MGARMAMASVPNTLSLRSRPPPPNIDAHMAIWARNVMPMATEAATELIRMSRLRTWLISWASTPWSSSHVSTSRIPLFTQTAACSGLRPVAKALGWGSGDT